MTITSWGRIKLYRSFLAAVEGRKIVSKILSYPITRKNSHSRATIVRAVSLRGGFVMS